MANIIRIRRKALGAGTGAPNSLINAELAFNEDTRTLYYGLGTIGVDNEASNIIPIGGEGGFVSLGNVNQEIDGTKTFNSIKSTTVSATNITVDNLTINTTTNIPNLNADLLDGQHGSYYLDWTNATNKPDPVITVNLSGDVSGSGNATLTDLASGTISISTVVQPNSVTLGTDTTGNYVQKIINSSNITGGVDAESADATLDLTTTGVNAGTYGSQTLIPILTVDNKGRITSASTTAVATGLNIAGNTGTDTVNLLVDTLTVSGGTHVTSTVTDNKISISLDATSTSTNSAIVSRDSGGGFATTTVTASYLKSTGDLNVSTNGTNNTIYLTPSGTGTVDVASKRISNVAEPTQAQDAATKNYVDLTTQGLDPKQSVRLATTAEIPVIMGISFLIDGVYVSAGDRILVKNQSNKAENGIYVASSGAWTRTLDMNDWSEVPSAYVFVEKGDVNAEMGYLCTSDQGGIIGVNDIIWVQFNGAGQVIAGNGLNKSGNTLSVVGTTNRISVGSTVDIDANYIGQTTINTLGTVSGGTWQGTTVAVGYGGTGRQSFTSNGIVYGDNGNQLQVTSAGTWDGTNDVGQVLSVNSSGVPTWTNTIDGGSY